jgi:hypothetical protein
MKRFVFASLVAVGLVAGSQTQAQAHGGGIGFGLGVGFGLSWSASCSNPGYCPQQPWGMYPPMMPMWGGYPFMGMPEWGQQPCPFSGGFLPAPKEDKKEEKKEKLPTLPK